MDETRSRTPFQKGRQAREPVRGEVGSRGTRVHAAAPPACARLDAEGGEAS